MDSLGSACLEVADGRLSGIVEAVVGWQLAAAGDRILMKAYVQGQETTRSKFCGPKHSHSHCEVRRFPERAFRKRRFQASIPRCVCVSPECTVLQGAQKDTERHH